MNKEKYEAIRRNTSEYFKQKYFKQYFGLKSRKF